MSHRNSDNFIAPDKRRYEIKILLISAQNHMLWVLIRSAFHVEIRKKYSYFLVEKCLILSFVVSWVNSVEPDQMPHSSGSDLGQHCLLGSFIWDARCF